jgi:hypothetical protein
MVLDDYLESEVALAVAATAAVLSPRLRGVLRSGAVYGLAGALIAGDAVASVARGAGRGAQQAAGRARSTRLLRPLRVGRDERGSKRSSRAIRARAGG